MQPAYAKDLCRATQRVGKASKAWSRKAPEALSMWGLGTGEWRRAQQAGSQHAAQSLARSLLIHPRHMHQRIPRGDAEE